MNLRLGIATTLLAFMLAGTCTAMDRIDRPIAQHAANVAPGIARRCANYLLSGKPSGYFALSLCMLASNMFVQYYAASETCRRSDDQQQLFCNALLQSAIDSRSTISTCAILTGIWCLLDPVLQRLGRLGQDRPVAAHAA